ncbi:MAG: transposase [bacterium]|nr:transposase [bacterium]
MKVFLGRVYRDIIRKINGKDDLQTVFSAELALAKRLPIQQRQNKNKLYSLHAPEVECIGKGKAHKKFEFGVKVSVAVTNRDNFIVGMQSEPGKPYDGHTLAGATTQVERITEQAIKRAFVDRGYRGHKLKLLQVLISGSK